MKEWQLQEAKARLSELVKNAVAEGPQNITVHGISTVVVVSAEEYNRLIKPKISFLELLRRSPLIGLDLEFERDKSENRDVDL